MKPFVECTSERPPECFMLTICVASIYLQVVATYGTFHEMSLEKIHKMFLVTVEFCLHLFIGGHCMWNL